MPQSREGETQTPQTSSGESTALRRHSETRTEGADGSRKHVNSEEAAFAAIVREPGPSGSLVMVGTGERTGVARVWPPA